jgi:hypothetical protein
VSADKRDECGCHKGCTTLPHACEVPCRWPSCLTDAEHAELVADIIRDDLLGGSTPPTVRDP